MSILKILQKLAIARIILLISPVFIFIFSDILCENFITLIYNTQNKATDLIFLSVFSFLQFFLAPIQSSFSDVYGRKKGLIYSLSFSLLSLIFMYSLNSQYFNVFFILILATIAKGAFGNTLPIALSIIADLNYKNFRVLFAFATAAYATAYLVLSISIHPDANVIIGNNKVSYQGINLYLICIFSLLIIFCIILRNLKNHQEKKLGILQTLFKETSLLIKDVKYGTIKQPLKAFFLWEISLYLLLISQVDFKLTGSLYVAESMMIGYLTGVCILFFSYRLKDLQVMRLGYWISFLSLSPYLILFYFIKDHDFLLRLCCFLHAIGNSFLSPSFLSLLAKGSKSHEQGRRYGLADSVDTLAYWLGAMLIIFIVRIMNLDVLYLLIISFLIFSYSWKYYNSFKLIEDQAIKYDR